MFIKRKSDQFSAHNYLGVKDSYEQDCKHSSPPWWVCVLPGFHSQNINIVKQDIETVNMTGHPFFTGYVAAQNSKCNFFSVKFFDHASCVLATHISNVLLHILPEESPTEKPPNCPNKVFFIIKILPFLVCNNYTHQQILTYLQFWGYESTWKIFFLHWEKIKLQLKLVNVD